jgi:VWFA-related protein
MKNFNPLVILPILISFVFLSSCSLTSPGEDNLNVETEFSNPHPENHASNQPVVVTLEWDASGFEKYDVYFSKISPPDIAIAKNLTTNSYVKSGLSYSTHYFWRVRGYKSDGSWVESPIWDFTTRSFGARSGEGALFIPYDDETEAPNFVKTLFEVIDNEGYPVSDLTLQDLEIYDDGELISPSESFLLLEQYLQNNYVMKVALVLDNSTSLRDDLDEIKNAANDFVDNITDAHHKIAIYKFSETTELVQDFTSDVNLLHNAINSLPIGQPSTDLYGAVITGTSAYEENVDRLNFETGATVIFTDGTDTQGSHTLEQALEATQDKRVYTVGLGEEINPEILQEIGNSGFFYIEETNELINVFQQIKEDIERYSQSFYWLTYASPKRGSNMHTLVIMAKDNPINSYLETVYSSAGFFSAPQGLYLNPTASEPEGITEISLAKNTSKVVTAYSFYYVHPSYEWTITSGADLIDISYPTSEDNQININAGGTKGDAEIFVEDTANNLSKTLTVHITD